MTERGWKEKNETEEENAASSKQELCNDVNVKSAAPLSLSLSC